MINPTVGRVVWFWPGELSVGRVVSPEQPFAAQVAFVHNERCVNITYVDHEGEQWSATSVPLLQDDDPRPENGSSFCEWMPYQKGQAARAEALEATAAARAQGPTSY